MDRTFHCLADLDRYYSVGLFDSGCKCELFCNYIIIYVSGGFTCPKYG
jgi:hypothetical protein